MKYFQNEQKIAVVDEPTQQIKDKQIGFIQEEIEEDIKQYKKNNLNKR